MYLQAITHQSDAKLSQFRLKCNDWYFITLLVFKISICKGRLISKCPFGVSKSTKTLTKIYPSYTIIWAYSCIWNSRVLCTFFWVWQCLFGFWPNYKKRITSNKSVNQIFLFWITFPKPFHNRATLIATIMSKKIQQYKVCQLWKMKMRTKIESAQNKQAKNSLIYLIIQLAHTRQHCIVKSNSLWSL